MQARRKGEGVLTLEYILTEQRPRGFEIISQLDLKFVHKANVPFLRDG
jgi:hypothetical protein